MHKLAEFIIKDAEEVVKKTDLSPLAGKALLLTGASGLIGTYFLASIGNFNNRNKEKIKTTIILHSEPDEYFKDLMDQENTTVVIGDMAEDGFSRNLPIFDFIIHAVGYGQPGKFMEDRVKTIRLNTSVTLELFDHLELGGKFLFLSTSEVYSGLNTLPYKEDSIGTTNTNHPRSCYIESKRAGEAICNAYRHKGVEAKSARVSLVYGPGTKIGDMRVINNFIFKAINNGKLELLDKGEAKRNYCYVTDAVEIMWQVLLNGKDDIYNVGGFSKTTIGELAEKIGKYIDVAVVFPENLKPMGGAPEDVSLDMTKVESEFNKKDYVSLNDGLAKTIEWQKYLYRK
ncbi:NAD-dependent epimerase/dehydratase family protein [Patescibacteria group bacterium]|nr:NAD-dependent epimerase/dehydratase family protein [Patescibacteria group bacterium]